MVQYCTLEQVKQVTEKTKDITIQGLTFQIGKVSDKTVNKLGNLGVDSTDNETMIMIREAVVQPKFNEDISISADIMIALGKAISDFSGLGVETGAEKN